MEWDGKECVAGLLEECHDANPDVPTQLVCPTEFFKTHEFTDEDNAECQQNIKAIEH